jgi:catechol 2,3-dioxygenase-like lactoylglutathione lyase family enzyme
MFDFMSRTSGRLRSQGHAGRQVRPTTLGDRDAEVLAAEYDTSQGALMTVQRMDNVGIVVDDLPATIEFFRELGLELEGQATIEGEWAGRVTGLGIQRVEIAMMRTPDGHSRLELSRFLTPPTVADHRNAPVNALGYLRVMFAVDDIDDTLARLGKHGAQLVSSEVVQYEDAYRLCYIRGPGGLLIGLAQELR